MEEEKRQVRIRLMNIGSGKESLVKRVADFTYLSLM